MEKVGKVVLVVLAMVALMIMPAMARNFNINDMPLVIGALYFDDFTGTWTRDDFDSQLLNSTKCGNVDSLKIGTGGSLAWGRVFVPIDLSSLPSGLNIDGAILTVKVSDFATYPTKIFLANYSYMNNISIGMCEEGGYAYANDLRSPCVNTPIDIEDLSLTGQGNFIITNEIKQAYETGKTVTFVLTDEDEINDMGETFIYPSKVSDSCGYAESSYMNLYIHSYSPDDLIDVGEGIGGFFTNFQGGLLSLLLGLIIVGVVGMFFYAVFNVVSTSVKAGFNK